MPTLEIDYETQEKLVVSALEDSLKFIDEQAGFLTHEEDKRAFKQARKKIVWLLNNWYGVKDV